MNVRFTAALAGVAMFLAATAASAAQTTMAPAPGPVIGPTAAPVPVPVGGAAPSAPTAQRMMIQVPAGDLLALDARSIRGTRTRTGYHLTGQAEVKDACTAARFTRLLGDIFPPFFTVVQYRRPGTMGMFCIQRLTWVTAQPLDVSTAAPPRSVTVRTQKGSMRVPILPVPAS
jgi:hypothetical protein